MKWFVIYDKFLENEEIDGPKYWLNKQMQDFTKQREAELFANALISFKEKYRNVYLTGPTKQMEAVI